MAERRAKKGGVPPGAYVPRRTKFGRLITEARLKRHWPTHELARRLGLGRGYISQLENGHGIPDARKLWLICKVLKLDPKELLQALAASAKQGGGGNG